MHFIGMLAFVLPTPVTYRFWITLGSAVPAVLGSAVALQIMSRESITWWRLQLGSLALALAIGTMHCVGMEALTVDATMHYRPGMFALSIGVAYLLSMLALHGRFVANRHGLSPPAPPRGRRHGDGRRGGGDALHRDGRRALPRDRRITRCNRAPRRRCWPSSSASSCWSFSA